MPTPTTDNRQPTTPSGTLFALRQQPLSVPLEVILKARGRNKEEALPCRRGRQTEEPQVERRLPHLRQCLIACRAISCDEASGPEDWLRGKSVQGIIAPAITDELAADGMRQPPRLFHFACCKIEQLYCYSTHSGNASVEQFDAEMVGNKINFLLTRILLPVPLGMLSELAPRIRE